MKQFNFLRYFVDIIFSQCCAQDPVILWYTGQKSMREDEYDNLKLNFSNRKFLFAKSVGITAELISIVVAGWFIMFMSFYTVVPVAIACVYMV